MEFSHQGIIIDQILSYSVQAGETLQQNFFSYVPKGEKYTNLLLPHWSDLYTWPLKAAWYLLLDDSINTVILVKQADENKSKYKSKAQDIISIYSWNDIILLWKKIITTLDKYPKNLKKTNNISQEMLNQFFFLRLIKNIDKIFCLEVWRNVTDKEFLDTISLLSKNNKSWVVFFDVCSQNIPIKEWKKNDEYMIRQIYLQKINKKNDWLGNRFVSLNKQKKKKSEIVWYLNTWDFWDNLSKATGYVCIVA